MDCPNPQCNTKNLPNDARFCPNCGRKLILPKMIVKSCDVIPTSIKLGDECKIRWQGDFIKHVIINGIKYTQNSIALHPKQSQTVIVKFVGLDDSIVTKEMEISIIPQKKVRVIYV